MKQAAETKWRDSVAYGPRFLLSMAVALAAFAIVTYIATGSFAMTALRTLLCAVLVQVGYFLALLYLTRRAGKVRRAEAERRLHGKQDVDKSAPKVPVSMNEPGPSKF